MLGFGLNAGAAEFKVIPSVALKGEYNDNVFFDEDDQISDYIGTVTPGLEIINRTERLDLNLNGHYRIIRYKDAGELDAEDYDGSGRLSYSLTPVLRLNAGALYDKSTQPDRDVVYGPVDSDLQSVRLRDVPDALWIGLERTCLSGAGAGHPVPRASDSHRGPLRHSPPQVALPEGAEAEEAGSGPALHRLEQLAPGPAGGRDSCRHVVPVL